MFLHFKGEVSLVTRGGMLRTLSILIEYFAHKMVSYPTAQKELFSITIGLTWGLNTTKHMNCVKSSSISVNGPRPLNLLSPESHSLSCWRWQLRKWQLQRQQLRRLKPQHQAGTSCPPCPSQAIPPGSGSELPTDAFSWPLMPAGFPGLSAGRPLPQAPDCPHQTSLALYPVNIVISCINFRTGASRYVLFPQLLFHYQWSVTAPHCGINQRVSVTTFLSLTQAIFFLVPRNIVQSHHKMWKYLCSWLSHRLFQTQVCR